MKAETYLAYISIIINTHDLLGVPSEESQKLFFDTIWETEFDNWKLKSSEVLHYEVFEFQFEIEENNLEGIDNVKNKISSLAEKILKKLK